MGGAATVAGGPAYSFGAWGNLPLLPYRRLGVKFEINGKTHFGWARMIAKVSGVKITATLTGYAYETVPNTTIIAGKKAILRTAQSYWRHRTLPTLFSNQPVWVGWLRVRPAGLHGARKNAMPASEATK
jgi:hypothetical protein